MSPDIGFDGEPTAGLRDELRETIRGVRAYVEYMMLGGTIGVPRAERPIGPSLTEPPPSMAPEPVALMGIGDSATRGASLTAGVPAAAAAARAAMAGAQHKPAPPAASLGLRHGTDPTSNPQTANPAAPSQAGTTGTARFLGKTLTLPERQQRLSVLAGSIVGCTKCALHEKRTQTVFSRGTGSSGLCFVGEGPGFEEDREGQPFVGPAGQLLDKMIAAMGLNRDEVYICNIVKCRPPENRKPLPDEMRCCAPYLEEQLDILAPDVIVALGATAVEGLLGATSGITRLRGTWKLYKGRIAVMPTFHPAYLLRAPSAKHVVWEDLQAVLRHMGRPVPVRGKKPGA